METLNFEIDILATPEEVWEALWNERNFERWAKFFTKNLIFQTDWHVGGKTYFLDAQHRGLVSTISSLKKPFEVVFSHLGILENEVEIIKSKEVEAWSGVEEKYFLTEYRGFTRLRVILHSPNSIHEFVEENFRKGLEKVKLLAEQIKD